MKERLMLWGAAAGGALLVFVIGAGVYLGYSWYQRRYGATAERALERYFTALAQGDYGIMYEMTPSEDLMVLGRKLSEEEFKAQVEELLDGKEMQIEEMRLDRIARRGEYHYFRVSLHYSLGGTGKATRLLVELRSEDQNWKVTYPFSPSL